MSNIDATARGRDSRSSQTHGNEEVAYAAYRDELEARLHTMKREIDILQIQAEEAKRPWYKQASNIVAILALSFSLGTTYTSIRHTEQEDVQKARAELKELNKRATELSIEELDLAVKYAKDQGKFSQLRGIVRTELRATTLQAADIIDRIPNHVSAGEALAIAQQLQGFGMYSRAYKLYSLAISHARDAESLATSYRLYARSLFANADDFRGGRRQYQEALTAFQRFPNPDRQWVAYTNGFTQMLWAYDEYTYAKNCEESKKHVTALQQAIHQLVEGSRQQNELLYWLKLRQQDNCHD